MGIIHQLANQLEKEAVRPLNVPRTEILQQLLAAAAHMLRKFQDEEDERGSP